MPRVKSDCVKDAASTCPPPRRTERSGRAGYNHHRGAPRSRPQAHSLHRFSPPGC
ncbi:hypothetical protein BKA80DRAFT_110980 [Phyllosticta citrichinensis]